MITPPHFSRFLGVTRGFFQLEAAGGIILMFSAALALILANSPVAGLYQAVTGPQVLFWINDGLMAVFFFLVGLEIKREIVAGELSSRSKALLPALAAVGGMAAPALIYWFINRDTPATLAGWAIPSATDIAFSLGILALLGSRAPMSLKILLTAIAIIDDLGAVIIIALFYTDGISLPMLGFATGLIGFLALLNRKDCLRIWPYILTGVLLWIIMLKAGIHPTIAGVLTAFAIPVMSPRTLDARPLETAEHVLHPWVAFGILPVFAFANAGVPFAGMTLESLTEPVTFGIAAGLFMGKLAGIFLTCWLAIKSGLCPMPTDTRWGHIWGVAHLCGIGFTMSLFIGGLAFSNQHLQADIRLGVICGSVASALAAYAVLRWIKPLPASA